MFVFNRVKIRTHDMGLLFRDGDFVRLLAPGVHWFFDPLAKIRVAIASCRSPWLVHEQLDVIARSGALEGLAEVIDLKDDERALVWIDNRFSQILAPGLYAYWKQPRTVRVEVVSIRGVRFEHDQLKTIVASPSAARLLDVCQIQRDRVGVLFQDGRYIETVGPGMYAFWKGPADVKLVEVDLREALVDVTGQDIMTADKVTLRVNANVTYRIADAHQAISRAEDLRQAIHRETQLALRGVIGQRELDAFLSDKDAVAQELEQGVRRRAQELGLEVLSVGIRDVILPGEMKDLLNKVTEAKKAAEANLIARREETAAIRSQSNTARLLAESPTLMRLRELETLEKIAANGSLRIIVSDKQPGERGLTEKVTQLL